MKVVLFSQDPDLGGCCRTALGSLPSCSAPELIIAQSGFNPPTGDLYLWDYSPDLDLGILDKSDHHLVLVERQHLPELVNCLPAGVAVLVKPVPASALAAWMRRVQTPAEERGHPNAVAKGLHDFGAPLTAISGYCELLLAGELDPLTERQRAVLDRMRNSLVRLSRLRSEMFEQTAARHVAFHRQAAGIEPCIHQAIHEIQIAADKKRVSISAEIAPPRGSIYFDSGKLERVCCNLLDNACKFTGEGGRIEIRGYPLLARNSFRVDVFNTGPHIPPQYLERIFDEYASFGHGGATRGTGLGLAISKRIVERHGGKIWAENREEGPAISFMLPLRDISGRCPPAQGGHRTPDNYRKPVVAGAA